MMATPPVSFPLLRASLLEHEMLGGHPVQQYSIYCVDVGGSRWHGAEGYQQWTWLDGLTQVGGPIWRYGGVDGKSDEVYAAF
jgi:hypothetical protein